MSEETVLVRRWILRPIYSARTRKIENREEARNIEVDILVSFGDIALVLTLEVFTRRSGRYLNTLVRLV
jgi:hypothetical protein